MKPIPDDNTNVMQNLIDIISKQHDAFKFQTGAFIDTLYVTPTNSNMVKKVKANLNEVYIFSCKISSLLEEAKRITGTTEQKIEENDNTKNNGANVNIKTTDMHEVPKTEALASSTYNRTNKVKPKKPIKQLDSEKDDDLFYGLEKIPIKKETSIGFYDGFEFNGNSNSKHSDYDIFRLNKSNMLNVKNEVSNNMDFFNDLNLDKINSIGISNEPFAFNEDSRSRIFDNNFGIKADSKIGVKQESTEHQQDSQPLFQSHPSESNTKNYQFSKKRKRGAYNIVNLETKMEAVRLSRITSIKQAAENLKIPEKNIKRWMKNGPQRKKGAGRKTMDPNMEKNLLQWIAKEYRSTGGFPDSKEIKMQAKIFSHHEDFKASKGWCDKFIKRNYMFFEYLKEEQKSVKEE